MLPEFGRAAQVQAVIFDLDGTLIDFEGGAGGADLLAAADG